MNTAYVDAVNLRSRLLPVLSVYVDEFDEADRLIEEGELVGPRW